MFGISYGELFLLIGATAALIAGRLAGRSIGYVQLARGQFDNVMQQSQAHQVHKELQDAFAQLESIRYEVQSISLMNPGPMARRLMDNPQDPASLSDCSILSSHTLQPKEELKSRNTVVKDDTFRTSDSPNLHSQATAYAKLAESDVVKTGSLKSSAEQENLKDESGLFIVLPISAESTGMLPNRKENVKGTDIVLEALVEAEVARNAKDFFSQPENQIQ
ncbi:PREDICTED: sec-independent translocase [Prunus dulcis]|uniref:PREDICTED: sec-independent translocase n=1 Tax=Prunus dulcis TaxID=3755 RepID=A0A5E4G820_PRUDU|nr:PREDICTED: sec-independent translocase [Prunus dulcis]